MSNNIVTIHFMLTWFLGLMHDSGLTTNWTEILGLQSAERTEVRQVVLQSVYRLYDIIKITATGYNNVNYSQTSIIRASIIRGTRLSAVLETKIWYAQLI